MGSRDSRARRGRGKNPELAGLGAGASSPRAPPDALGRVPREIWDLLAALKAPVKPYDLLWRLQNARGRKAPPSTIYRGLNVLVETGFAHRISTTGAFVCCRLHAAPHEPAFLICDQCGEALEVDASIAFRPLTPLLSGKQFLVHNIGIVLRGLCAACRSPSE